MKKMNQCAIALVSVLLSAAFAQDKAAHSDVERRLLRMEDDWAQVDVTGDMDVLERTLAPDFVGTSRTGRLSDKKEFIARFEMEGVKSAHNSDMEVHIFADNVAVVTGIDNTKGRGKDGKAFAHRDRFTDTYVKREDVWKCVSAQVTRIQ